MSVLVDTSVWIEHFRNGNDALVKLLTLDLFLTHPMVLLEISSGTPPAPRIQTLNNIGLLQSCNQASLSEFREFIELERLYGLGCGLVDLSLLVSTLITPGIKLWTLDKHLADLARHFSVAHLPPPH